MGSKIKKIAAPAHPQTEKYIIKNKNRYDKNKRGDRGDQCRPEEKINLRVDLHFPRGNIREDAFFEVVFVLGIVMRHGLFLLVARRNEVLLSHV